MVNLTRKQKRIVKKIQALGQKDQLIAIQASGIEGINFDVAMSSLLDGNRISSIDGVSNIYNTYAFQVVETFKKYLGESDYGNAQVRAVVDARTAFIAGEGLSIVVGKEGTDGHKELFKKFAEKNRLHSTRTFDITKLTEMIGYAILKLDKAPIDDKDGIPTVGILSTSKGSAQYIPLLKDSSDINSIKGFEKDKDGEKFPVKLKMEQVVYIRTGGTGLDLDTLSTKVGSVLTECDNYDRSLKDLRRLNYTMARITPDFETKSSNETKQLTDWLNAANWKIGDARIGTAKFKYEVPTTGAHDNLKSEMATEMKTISGTTAVPVHWLGWVDMMSNRATAEEMYASVNNGTIMERNAIEDGYKELYKKMQRMYIDAGGDLITEVIDDFDVQLPLIDFGRFKAQVEAYAQLYADGVISMKTYRNIVPSIDPLFEEAQIKAEEDMPEVTMTDLDLGESEDEEANTPEEE